VLAENALPCRRFYSIRAGDSLATRAAIRVRVAVVFTIVSALLGALIAGLRSRASLVIQGIAPRGGSVYWSSFGCQALRKTPSSGGATTTIVPRVSALAIGANTSHLCFTPSNGQILSGPL
jgi:hypothetical protein